MPSRRVLAVSLALGAAALPFWADAAVSRAATPTNQLEQQNCPVPALKVDPDTVTFFGPTEKMWPPNHKLKDFAVTASETPGEQGQRVTLTVTIAEVDTRDGAGNPNTPDWTLNGQSTMPMAMAAGTDTVTIPLQLRAERAGTGAGRTYRIDWTASFDGGPHQCSSSDGGSSTDGTVHHAFVVTVPHDQGH